MHIRNNWDMKTFKYNTPKQIVPVRDRSEFITAHGEINGNLRIVHEELTYRQGQEPYNHVKEALKSELIKWFYGYNLCLVP